MDFDSSAEFVNLSNRELIALLCIEKSKNESLNGRLQSMQTRLKSVTERSNNLHDRYSNTFHSLLESIEAYKNRADKAEAKAIEAGKLRSETLAKRPYKLAPRMEIAGPVIGVDSCSRDSLGNGYFALVEVDNFIDRHPHGLGVALRLKPYCKRYKAYHRFPNRKKALKEKRNFREEMQEIAEYDANEVFLDEELQEGIEAYYAELDAETEMQRKAHEEYWHWFDSWGEL